MTHAANVFLKDQNLCCFERLKASVSLSRQPFFKGKKREKKYLDMQQITSLLCSRAELTHDPLSGCVKLTCHLQEREEVFNTSDKSEEPGISAIKLTLTSLASTECTLRVCVCVCAKQYHAGVLCC